MNNKNMFYAVLAIALMPSFALAEQQTTLDSKDSALKIGGEVESVYGVINQGEDFAKKLGAQEKYNKSSLATGASVKFNYDKRSDAGLEYGAFVKLNANTSKAISGSTNIASEVKAYLQGGFGKFEIGATSPVGIAMEVNSYSLARATGGLDGYWLFWLKNGGVILEDRFSANGAFLIAPQLPIAFDESTKSVKVNYFTPKINGFTFGISYTPDSRAKGTVNQTAEVIDSSGGGYKNIWQPAVRYETSFDNGIDFATALIGEFGQAKKVLYVDSSAVANPNGATSSLMDRNRLSAWQLRASVGYNGFSVAGAYGDIGKSGTMKNRVAGVKNDGQYWSLGSGYSTDKYGISINYMQGKRAGNLVELKDADGKELNVGNDEVKVLFSDTEYNKFEAVSIGADYQVMPGFMPYVEVARFKFKENNNFGANAKFNKGNVFLAGTKIKF
ncbi:porin [Candidatus Bandiella euplotis]|uniref:Porin n=1 Tax=Candidatus Bandiella euplotis TaxID=1664265 RepID=A0ABZ0UP96_9RICK|nr:porin [Candidatus Bandiella woodruffii]WPX97081.1 Porin [Candidatus Bandiella woodruffii]